VEFVDTKWVIRIHKIKEQTTQWPKENVQKDKQPDNNVQKKINKRTHNDLQNIHYKAKDGVTQTPLRFVDINGFYHLL
jgi:hypothetical protein